MTEKTNRQIELERIIEEDHLGKLYQAIEKVYEDWEERFKPYKHLLETYDAAVADPEQRKKLQEAGGFKTEESIAKSAQVLGVNLDDLKAYLDIKKQRSVAVSEAVDVPARRAEWQHLLETVPLNELTINNFPDNIQSPFVVVYTTDWCLPCQLTKPTFARLSSFFDKAPLYYSLDNELMKRDQVAFIPQLVAYFPGGRVVYSQCGENTEQLWKNMNLLITLGQGSEGKSRLECTEDTCQIVPLE